MAQYNYSSLRGEYRRLWAGMTVTKPTAAAREAQHIIDSKAKYKEVERTTGVPWFVVGLINLRESGGRFDRWLHNGDRMRNSQGQPIRTVNVPKGRPPNPNCTWAEGAFDALVVQKHFDRIDDWCPERVAYVTETMNGWGYRNPCRNIPSPYLWGATSVQKRGKFVEDHVYDRNAWDTQLGTMAVLKTVMAMDKDARFRPGVPKPMPNRAPFQEPQSPNASDTTETVNPLRKSKTMWGGVLLALTSIGSTFASMFEYVTTPLGFAAFCIILVLLIVGSWMVIKGRIDVQKLVKHLAEDASPEEA